MKKLFTLMLAVFAMVGMVNAKTKTTTLWEGTYENNIEIPVAGLVSGATITVSTTVASSDTQDDRKLRIFYTAAGDNWTQTSFTDVSDWVELTAGQESYSFTLTSSAYEILSDDTKSHQILYIGANNKNCVTISKITMTTEVPTADETSLLNSEWSSSWDAKSFAAQSAAKIGDVIQVQYKAFKDDSEGWPWVQFNFMDASGNNFVDPVAASKEKNSVTTFEFEIKTADVLEKIQNAGFSIKGDQFILTSVKLLTYADSYDAVSVTIGSEGIATWSHEKNLDFTDTGVTAYYASAVTTGTVTLTSTTTTWNYCGYILKGSEGTYTVKVVADKDASYPAALYLKGQTSEGTVAASANGQFHYIFAKEKNGTSETIGFYKLTSAHTLAAHKAYLETPTDITPTDNTSTPNFTRGITLDFGDGTTAILKVIDDGDARQIGKNDGKYYTLQGTSMQAPTRKGLYILNGKKVLVK